MTQDGKKFLGLTVADFKELVQFLVIAAIIVIPIRYFIMQPFLVSGSSMEPNFHSRDYLIVDKISYKIGSPKRGDVVVFRFPELPNQPSQKKFLVKRLVGLPGDTIKINTIGQITITNSQNPNGKIIDEDYVVNKDGDTYEITVPEGKVLVMGDNRPVSYDSRAWGLLPIENLVGRAYLRLWPLKDINYLPGKTDLLK